MRTYHEDGTLPENGEVFVFGSNLAGVHGAGAAKVALEKYGAEFGKGWGQKYRSYALPTKDFDIHTMPMFMIEAFIKYFVEITKVSPENKRWFVTRVGCGLAGLDDKDIAPLFKGAVNCSFAEEWKKYLDN